MAGENHINMELGITKIIKTLRSDPYALETVFLSIIVFAGRSQILNPLTEVSSFVPTKLPIGSGTSLGLALADLMDEIDLSVSTSTRDKKGDWKPIVFLFTDGTPTDNVETSIMRWNQSYRNNVNLVAVSIGHDADLQVLKRLTDHVLLLSDTSDDGFTSFINWVSRSIQSQSRSVSTGSQTKISLDKTYDQFLVEVDGSQDLGKGRLDSRFAIFTGKCARTKNPYLLKYKRVDSGSRMVVPESSAGPSISYTLDVALALDNTYFGLTSEEALTNTINSSSLSEVPLCPHCEASSSLAICGCGKIHCIDKKDTEVCPWCGNTGIYSVSNLDIQRGLG